MGHCRYHAIICESHPTVVRAPAIKLSRVETMLFHQRLRHWWMRFCAFIVVDQYLVCQPSWATRFVWSLASVPIQKFLSSLSVNVERALAEAPDGRQNIVCRLGPAQGLWLGISEAGH